jgi:hypothetical protein
VGKIGDQIPVRSVLMDNDNLQRLHLTNPMVCLMYTAGRHFEAQLRTCNEHKGASRTDEVLSTGRRASEVSFGMRKRDGIKACHSTATFRSSGLQLTELKLR